MMEGGALKHRYYIIVVCYMILLVLCQGLTPLFLLRVVDYFKALAHWQDARRFHVLSSA